MKYLLSSILYSVSLLSCAQSKPECGELQSVIAQPIRDCRIDESFLREAHSDEPLKALLLDVDIFEDIKDQERISKLGDFSGHHAHFILNYEGCTHLLGMYRAANLFSIRKIERLRPNKLNKTSDESYYLESPELYSQLLAYLEANPIKKPEPSPEGELYVAASLKSWRFAQPSEYQYENIHARLTKLAAQSHDGKIDHCQVERMRMDINEWIEKLPAEILERIAQFSSCCGEVYFVPGLRYPRPTGPIAGYYPEHLHLPAMFLTRDFSDLPCLMDNLQLLYQLHHLGYIECCKDERYLGLRWSSKAENLSPASKEMSLTTRSDEHGILSMIDSEEGTTPAIAVSYAEHREELRYDINPRRGTEGYSKGVYPMMKQAPKTWDDMPQLVNQEAWLSYLEQQDECQHELGWSTQLNTQYDCVEHSLEGWTEPKYALNPKPEGARSEYRLYSIPKGDVQAYFNNRRSSPVRKLDIE